MICKMTCPTRTHLCVDCKLSIVKCQCDHIDLCLKTDMLLGFLKYDGEYSNDRDSKKHRLEFFKYFKPKPKIVFKKKQKRIVKYQIECSFNNDLEIISSLEMARSRYDFYIHLEKYAPPDSTIWLNMITYEDDNDHIKEIETIDFWSNK